MLTIATIDLTFNGHLAVAHLAITPEAHSVGFASLRTHHSVQLDDLMGDPSGAALLASAVHQAAADLSQEMYGAWSEAAPLWP